MAYSITENNYFKKIQPAKSEELLNTIEVTHHPQEVKDFVPDFYKSMDAIPLPYMSTTDIEIKYNEPPCIHGTAISYETNSAGDLVEDNTTGKYTNKQLTINTIEYYAWGAKVNVTNNNIPVTSTTTTTLAPQVAGLGTGYCVIVIPAWPIKTQGKEGYIASNAISILENGILKYSYPDNYLIQKRTIAKSIADALLLSYVMPRKDVTLEWRGDPSLELTDLVDIPEYNKHGVYSAARFMIYKQIINYNGTLKSNIEARKVIDIDGPYQKTINIPATDLQWDYNITNVIVDDEIYREI